MQRPVAFVLLFGVTACHQVPENAVGVRVLSGEYYEMVRGGETYTTFGPGAGKIYNFSLEEQTVLWPLNTANRLTFMTQDGVSVTVGLVVHYQVDAKYILNLVGDYPGQRLDQIVETYLKPRVQTGLIACGASTPFNVFYTDKHAFLRKLTRLLQDQLRESGVKVTYVEWAGDMLVRGSRSTSAPVDVALNLQE